MVCQFGAGAGFSQASSNECTACGITCGGFAIYGHSRQAPHPSKTSNAGFDHLIVQVIQINLEIAQDFTGSARPICGTLFCFSKQSYQDMVNIYSLAGSRLLFHTT
jgi:hypothetical protein